MLDLRQTKEYSKYLRLEGWKIERIDGLNYFLKKIPIVGFFIKVQRPEKIDFKVIDKLIRKYGVFQTIIEPKDYRQAELLGINGYKLAKNTYLPSKTLCIDLTKTIKEIKKDFKRNIKVGVRKAAFAESYGRPRGERLQLTREYSTPDELKTFRDAWKNSVKFNRYIPSLKSLLNLRKSFGQKKCLFLASHNISGRIIGGVIFTISSHGVSNYITFYNYGFISNEGRSTLSMASLLYHGILWGKKMGCKTFDFEGIYDERFPNKSWLGFTRFKKSFGGYEVPYPGTYIKNNLFNLLNLSNHK